MEANAPEDAIPLGTQARAMLRRAPHPGMEPLLVDPGPHLFLDWRYVQVGEVNQGPYWADENGNRMPLRLWDDRAMRTQPFDAHFVARDVATGIRVEAEKSRKLEPFPEGGAPGTRIICDEGLYRTWYKPHEGVAGARIQYAESTDGFAWSDPVECRFDWSAGPPITDERPVMFIDPSAPDEERFKVMFRSWIPGGEEGKTAILRQALETRPDEVFPLDHAAQLLSCMWGAVSPDGLNWKGLPQPLSLHYSDTTNVTYYDEDLERYVWFGRGSLFGRRCITRTESVDFRRWPGPQPLVWHSAADNPADDWYTNAKTIYPGARREHLMFPALYHHEDDTLEVELFSSPDGIVWSQVPGGPVIEMGEPDAWDGGCMYSGWDLLPLGDDQVALPCYGYIKPHKYPRNDLTFRTQTSYAVWPRARLGGIVADAEGSFTTLPLAIRGNRLRLNLRVERGGEVRVEAADGGGEPLPGRTFAEADGLTGDALDRQVTWNGAADIAPDVVMLRFRLRGAKLFAFEFV